MKHLQRVACLALLIPMMTGCLPSMSRQPVSGKPLAVAKREWGGAWVADGTDTYHLKVQEALARRLAADDGWLLLDLEHPLAFVRQHAIPE